MAEPHAHSQPIETYGLAPHNRNIWPSAHNRNIWPYNSQAAAPPSRLADSFVCSGALLLITTDYSFNLPLLVSLLQSHYSMEFIWFDYLSFLGKTNGSVE